MIEGRIAGLAAAARGGYLTQEELEEAFRQQHGSLEQLRQGMFAPKNKGRTDLTQTDEGYALSANLLSCGYVADGEVSAFPSARAEGSQVHPVIECTQNIPCNPCQDACPVGCIKVGSNITSLPALNPETQCIGCGMCVASCPGQAIFLLREVDDQAEITLPYEFLPLPQKGDKGMALSRGGQPLCPAEVVEVKAAKAMDHTNLITMRVPKEFAETARFIQF